MTAREPVGGQLDGVPHAVRQPVREGSPQDRRPRRDREVGEGEDSEAYIRETAKYGVDVNHKDVEVEVMQIERVRLLGQIPKPD